MTEPLFEEEATAFERELLRAGASYRVSAESRARTLAALGIGATVGTVAVGTAAAGASTASAGVAGSTATLGSSVVGGSVAGSAVAGSAVSGGTVAATATGAALASQAGGGVAASGASLSLFAKLGGVKVGLAMAALGIASSVPVYYAFRSEAEPTPASASSAVTEPESPRPAAPPANAPAAAPEVVPASETAPPESRASVQKPKSGAEKASIEKEALRAEIASLDRVRAKLSSKNAAGALALLDEYGRSFPRGLLSLEAEVLRIDALAQSGQPDAAKKRAKAFLRQHPKGVLATRVRRYAEP